MSVKLVASAIIRNEAHRYLKPWLAHLREFCDEIRILDDASTDETNEILRDRIAPGGVALMTVPEPLFDVHEGQARQRLLEWTLEAEPTHVLAIDADEFIGDGARLRTILEGDPVTPAWTLTMTEVWDVTDEALGIRVDGAWRPYDRVHLWAVPPQAQRQRAPSYWQIPQRKLACPPIPLSVIRSTTRASAQRIYHFGWADPSTRQARYDRYMALDGGRFHARGHLNSIIWPPERIQLQNAPWPDAMWAEALRGQLVAA